MVLKSYLIAPFKSGLQNNVEPWLLPEDAFQIMTNAYTWRGRVRKRFGYSFIGDTALRSKLRINIGTTTGGGTLTPTVPGTIFAIGQQFSIGTEVFTVWQSAGTMLTTGGASTATYDTVTGIADFAGVDAATSVYFYPSTPVMGLHTREQTATNVETVVAFDQEFAYIRSGAPSAWELLGDVPTAGGYAQWSSSNSEFFWTTNYKSVSPDLSALWVVNNKARTVGPPLTDGIKYINATLNPTTWVNIRPELNSPATRFLESGAVIIGYKDRLLVLNTLETTGAGIVRFKNRVRWSQNGLATVAATSWLEAPGKGGFVDATTKEAIITVEFVKGVLIVYFERSTWELQYTGDPIIPFIWNQLNSELGAESRFSIVGFDKGAVGVGNVGIHKCNGVNVDRIDEQIPDEVFNIHNGNSGPERVYGIRDYFNELVYWTYPDQQEDPTFPTRVLVWNYQNNTWAFFEDSFTCFGKFQQSSDLSWATVGQHFPSWLVWDAPWNASSGQSEYPSIISGNQQGYVFIIDSERSSNVASLSITDMDTALQQITVINHNLQSGDFLTISGALGITLLLNDDVVPQDIVTFKVIRTDADTLSIDNGTAVNGKTAFGWTGTYTGAGLLARISQYNISSKQWNPGTPVGLQFRMPYMDFLLVNTTVGQVSVDYSMDSSINDSIQDQTVDPKVLLGNNTLFTGPEDNATYQPRQVRIWHRYYIQSQGMMLQIKIYMTDDQMRNLTISQSGFEMDGMILYVEPSGRITG